MPGPSHPGDVPPDLPPDLPDLPPDLPPEYAEAYRRGFERAYNERTGEIPAFDQVQPETVDSRTPIAEPRTTRPAGTERGRDGIGDDRHRLAVPAILVVLALCLVLAAYGLGRLFSSEVAGADAASPEPADGVVIGDDADGSGGSESPKPKQKPYDGAVSPVQVDGAKASCTSDPSIDAAGNTVSYDVANIYDGDPSSAWRCDGSGVGESVAIDLPDQVAVVEVGLIPGYAKTDPVDGADRYAENNRITRVRWVFGGGGADGVVITQTLDGSATDRSMQTIRIAETEASSVRIEILASTAGTRSDTVAIGEVAIGGPAN